jgi:hypothetical protein
MKVVVGGTRTAQGGVKNKKNVTVGSPGEPSYR